MFKPLSSVVNWNWNWLSQTILQETHLNWKENSSIGIFLVSFQKWSEQLYQGRLSTAQGSGCFRLYVSQTTVKSTFCSTKVSFTVFRAKQYIYIYIYIYIYYIYICVCVCVFVVNCSGKLEKIGRIFAIQRAYGTLKLNLVKF